MELKLKASEWMRYHPEIFTINGITADVDVS